MFLEDGQLQEALVGLSMIFLLQIHQLQDSIYLHLRLASCTVDKSPLHLAQELMNLDFEVRCYCPQPRFLRSKYKQTDSREVLLQDL
jgi:hypothetical protein